MFSSRRADQARRYVCTKAPGTGACGKTTTRAEPLEELVAELIIAAVDDAGLRATIGTKCEKDDGLVDVVRADEEALEALAKDFYAERLLLREEFMAARGALNQRLEVNRLKLAKRTSSGAVGRFLGHGELLRASWMQASLEWRRPIVGALLEQVEISPGRAGRLPFEPVRVRPVWKY